MDKWMNEWMAEWMNKWDTVSLPVISSYLWKGEGWRLNVSAQLRDCLKWDSDLSTATTMNITSYFGGPYQLC